MDVWAQRSIFKGFGVIEIPTQLLNACPLCRQSFGLFYLPYGDEATEKTKTYKLYQILKSRFWGIAKPRSVKQLNLYFSACGFIAEMLSDHNNILSKEDIDFDVKIRVAKENPSMIKRFKVVSGITYVEPISVAFKNMKHLTACKYFDKAFPIMGKMVEIETEELIIRVKQAMKQGEK